jgi:hypothetical protein
LIYAFVDDIVLVDETRCGVNVKLEIWRDVLECKSFWLSRTKAKYIECKFAKIINKNEGIVILDGQEIPNSECFRYLRLTIHKDEEIEEDLNHRIRTK